MAKQPWHPAQADDATIIALQALAAGKATEGQQTSVLEWIVFDVCGTYDETYFAQSERDSAYAQGKRHVGLQLVKYIKMAPVVLDWNKAKRTKPERPNRS